jgi:hypothetical protein
MRAIPRSPGEKDSATYAFGGASASRAPQSPAPAPRSRCECCSLRSRLKIFFVLSTLALWAYVLAVFEPETRRAHEHQSATSSAVTAVKRRRSASPLESCGNVDVAWLEARLAGAVARRTRPCAQTYVGGAPFSPSTILRVNACVRGAWERGAPDVSRDFVFVVMGGSVEIERAFALRKTWATLVPEAAVVLVGDIDHRPTRMIT